MKIKGFFLLILSTLFCVYVNAQQQHPENCPFGGVVDCTGQCGLFTDENGDGICDNAVLSRDKKPAKQDAEQTDKKQEVTKDNNKIEKQINQAVEKVNESKKIDFKATEDTTETLSGATETMTETVAEETSTVEVQKAERKFPYHLWQVLIATLGLYIVSAVLVKMKVIKKVNHRRFWNAILGITFFVSCLIGLYVVFAKMYGWSMNYLTLMQLHVDFGISMAVVAVIHCFWHINYWKNLFKSTSKKS